MPPCAAPLPSRLTVPELLRLVAATVLDAVSPPLPMARLAPALFVKLPAQLQRAAAAGPSIKTPVDADSTRVAQPGPVVVTDGPSVNVVAPRRCSRPGAGVGGAAAGRADPGAELSMA